MKKSGVDLIGEEREEQLNVHEFTIGRDKKVNGDGQLAEAAIYVISKDPYHFPKDWNTEWYTKLTKKKGIEALKVAGALIAAEIDRLQN